ncbi:MAG: flagellar biosynthetic protein FliO, partial [Planctomycetota bacterium]
MPIVPLAASCLCGIGLARADAPAAAPSPPLPEEVPAANEAQPATFEPAAASPAAGPLPLTGPAATPNGGPAPARPLKPLGDWTVLAAIGAAFALLAALRLRPLRRTRQLPPDVFELLGEASLGGPHAVRVVRFGPRTLLVGVSAAGCQTLAEIDDPQATERIAAACLGERPAVRVAARPAPPRVAGVGLVLFCLALGPGSAAAADEAASAANAPAAVTATDVVPVTPQAPEPPATPPATAPAAVAAGSGEPATPSGWNPASLLQGRSLAALVPSAMLSAMLFGVATLAPAVLLMTTCFVRMSVVLGLVRQGLGAAQVPGNQVVASLAIFLSALVMWPVWTQAWNDGVAPYQAGSLT